MTVRMHPSMTWYIGLCLCCQTLAAQPQADITADHVTRHVQFLASEQLDGRGSGTAAEYIRRWLDTWQLAAPHPGTRASECSAADAGSKLLNDFSVRFSRRYAVILVPLQLNGKTLELMLSTSSTYTVLDARFRSLLQESATNVTIKSREIVSLHKQPPPLSSDGNNVCQLETIACMDLSSFCEAGGIWCDGILGLDFLRSALARDNSAVAVTLRRSAKK